MNFVKYFSAAALFIPLLCGVSFSVFANGGESNDFILIDTEFAGSVSIGETENEDFEEAKLIDIQRIGESDEYIEADFYCGNGRREYAEQCDGNDFNGKSCSSFGFIDGTLTCSSTCQTISTQNCNSVPSPTPAPVSASPGGGSNGGGSGNSGGGSGSGGGGSNGGIVASLAATPTPLPTQAQYPTATPVASISPTSTPSATPLPEVTPAEDEEGEENTETDATDSQETEENISTNGGQGSDPGNNPQNTTGNTSNPSSTIDNSLGSIIEISDSETQDLETTASPIASPLQKTEEEGERDEQREEDTSLTGNNNVNEGGQFLDEDIFKYSAPEEMNTDDCSSCSQWSSYICILYIILAFLLGLVLGLIITRFFYSRNEQ